MWNGTMFVDLDWPLNASSLLSASAELLVDICGDLKVTRPFNAMTKIAHIFETGRNTKFKFGLRMEYDEMHHWHAQWPPKLWVAVQVTNCRGVGILCWPHYRPHSLLPYDVLWTFLILIVLIMLYSVPNNAMCWLYLQNTIFCPSRRHSSW